MKGSRDMIKGCLFVLFWVFAIGFFIHAVLGVPVAVVVFGGGVLTIVAGVIGAAFE